MLSVQLPERVYALDVKHPLLVVGCADRHIWVYNLNTPDKPYKQLQSPLKWQTRCVACFPGVLACDLVEFNRLAGPGHRFTWHMGVWAVLQDFLLSCM